MPTAYTYPDAYLARFCVEEREARALSIVEGYADAAEVTLSADWTERLTIAQTYILAALENQADPEDLFSAKLKAYREEFGALLPQAVAAAKAAEGEATNIAVLSIPIERS